jgi:DNA primase
MMFAVIDVMGRDVAFSGRALPDPSPAEIATLGTSAPRSDPDKKPAKYINSPESPIYTKGEHLFGLHQAKAAIRQEGEAVLVEGNFDVVALHARGVGNAIAPLGTAFTPDQAKLLKRFAQNVVVLFDGDAAGRKATRAARVPCREGGLTARVAELSNGVDPDEFSRTKGAPAMKRVIQGAKGMLEYLIDDALDGKGFGGAALTEQLARIRAVATLLREEDDPSLRAMAKVYADRLSSKLIIGGRSPSDLRQLEQLMEQATSRIDESAATKGYSHGAPIPVPDRAKSPARIAEIGLAIVGAALEFPELLDDPDVEGALSVVEGDAALAVAALRQWRFGTKGIYAAEFLAQIPGPIHSFAAGRLASPAFEGPSEAKTELLENARKLKRLILQRENAAIADQPNKAEAAGDVASVEAMLRDVERRSREKLGLS